MGPSEGRTRMSRVNRSPDSGDVVPQWDIPRTWSKPLLWLHWLRPRCLSVGLTLLPYFSCPSRRLHVPGSFNFFGLSLWFGPHFPSFMHGPCRLLVGNPQSFPRGLTLLRNLVEVSVSLWCDLLSVCLQILSTLSIPRAAASLGSSCSPTLPQAMAFMSLRVLHDWMREKHLFRWPVWAKTLKISPQTNVFHLPSRLMSLILRWAGYVQSWDTLKAFSCCLDMRYLALF